MISAKVILVTLAAAIIWPSLSGARPIRQMLPEDLEPKASLICNGTVISVEETSVKKDFQYPEIAPLWHSNEVVMLAKIKVLHVFKGTSPAMIEFRYRVLAPSPGTTIVVDGPEHVELQKGERCRFFLKPDEKLGGYVGVLEGNYDDNFAVETLAPTEPDATPYLKKDDAIKFALDHLRPRITVEEFDLSRSFVQCLPEIDGGATWFVMLYHLGSTSETYSEVYVHADHTMNEKITKLNEGHGN